MMTLTPSMAYTLPGLQRSMTVPTPPHLTPDQLPLLESIVTEELNYTFSRRVRTSDLHTRSRKLPIAIARQFVMGIAAWHISKEHPGEGTITVVQIGAFYMRDHATVCHAKKQLRDLVHTHSQYRECFTRIIRTVVDKLKT